MAELSGIPTAPDAPEIVSRSLRETFRPGQVIAGRYEVSSRLGAGGMGTVYRVHDRVLDEDVALKVIVPAALGDAKALERMRAEVKIARKITHPNVCRVFDVGEDQGLLFLTMELIEGRTLRHALMGGAIEPSRALDLLQQIVAGMAAAHEQGVVHRDLKPENILLRNDERCVVADFGLARGLDGEAKTVGEKAGTFAYMSPEQRRGEALDVRSDVYALGLIGRELLGEVSGGVVEVLAKALAELPEERFATAGDMGAALKKVPTTFGEKLPTTLEEVHARPSPGFSDTVGTPNSPPPAAQTTGSPRPRQKNSDEVLDSPREKVPTSLHADLNLRLSAEISTQPGERIEPSTMRNPAMSGQMTVSRPFPVDAIDSAFIAIRAAHDRGDRDGAKLAWIDLGALLGFSPAENASKSIVKRPRKRSA